MIDIINGSFIGEIRCGKDIGKHQYSNYIWHACNECGKERWARYLAKEARTHTEYCLKCYHIGERNSFFGKQHTDESKRKISKNNVGRRGQVTSAEHRAKISRANKITHNRADVKARMSNMPHFTKGTPEHEQLCLKISIANKGKKRTPEMIAAWKIMLNQWIEENDYPNKGHKWTDEAKIRQSIRCKGVQAGAKHPLWRGGISKIAYGAEWTAELKEVIKKRDNYTCQLCLRDRNEVTLAVHHIDYNKRHNKSINHITLCRGCNPKVNLSRDFWQAYFQTIMYNRYTLLLQVA